MEKELLVKVLDKIILEWVSVVVPGDFSGRQPILPKEDTIYVTKPKKTEQSKDNDTIVVHDIMREEDIVMDMTKEFYIRATFNGLLPSKTNIHDFGGDKHPNPDKYNKQYLDKVSDYKYRINSVLKVAEDEWKNLHVYDLIEIAQSEYNYDAEPFVDDDNCKEKIIGILKQKFIDRAKLGHSSMVEHKLEETKNILNVIGADISDIQNVRDKWLDVIRKYRNDALKALDEEEEVAKSDSDEQGIEEIKVIKDMLRNLPQEIQHLDHLNSPNDIVDFWPAILLPKPNHAEIK